MKVRLVNKNFENNYLENYLFSKGVEDFETFLYPTEELIQDPMFLDNIYRGAELFLNHVMKDSKILLIVDPDCDGFTSSAILYQYAKKLNSSCNLTYAIHEGKAHGLSDLIEDILSSTEHYDLIICPDSGSNDIEYHKQLLDFDCQVLVIDHHLVDAEISDNTIIINNQSSKEYKNKDLTGAGMVYQFCKYVDNLMKFNGASEFIDLAALGVIGDMGSLLSLENRAIIRAGLDNITNDFFWALLRKQGYSISGKMAPSDTEILEKLSPTSIAFYIVPLINAMIRVGTQSEKTKMFEAFIDGKKMVPSTKRGAKGSLEEIAVDSARECANAKSRQQKLQEKMLEKIEQKIYKYDLLENKILVIELDEDDDFPSELNGLLAMKCAAKFNHPTIVGRVNEDGFLRGSARGLNESELKDLKKFFEESNYFEYALGHPGAFGCSISQKNLNDFFSYSNQELASIDFNENVYDINFERKANDKDLSDLILAIGSFEHVWGQGVPEPLIYITNIEVSVDDIKIMGKNKDTVRIDNNGISYIMFKANELIDELSALEGKVSFNIVGKANINEWMGRFSPQIKIESYEIVQEKAFSIFDF